jgi:hypothetical protein
MSDSRFRRLVNLRKVRREDCNSTESAGHHIGDYIGSIPSALSSRRGLHDHCWEARDKTREKYCELIPQIKTFLETCLEVTSSSDIVISFYMIGSNPMNASPTVILISEDAHSRQSARKLLKKSEILSHDGFKVISLSRDPGVQSMKRLASDDADRRYPPMDATKSYMTGTRVCQVQEDAICMDHNATPQTTFSAVLGSATEVFINPSQPINSSSTLIYIRHGAAFRPATAFPIHIGSKVYLRTVQHAFTQDSTSPEEYVSDVEECRDITVDYDSDEDLNGLDDIDVAMTSIGSQSPDDWPDSGSDNDGSFHSRTTSGRSTPCLNHNVFQESGSMMQDLQRASANLAAFESKMRVFSPTRIYQPDKHELDPVGKLIASSVDLDCALIEVANDYLIEQLNQAHDAASDTIAQKPQDSTAITAYTSSGGSLNGVMFATPSLVRLPGARQLQAVHTIRLDGPLANGDCGSAVRDQCSKRLYGHIISGCPITGTAYVLAAHQVQSYVDRISSHLNVRALHLRENQTGPYSPRSVVPSIFQHAKRSASARSIRRLPIWQVARVTSAATTYFSHIAIGSIRFVDGAIGAENSLSKNHELGERDKSAVELQELEESSLVAEKPYRNFSPLSITTKLLICAVCIIYKALEKSPLDDQQGHYVLTPPRQWRWILRILHAFLALPLPPTIGIILNRVFAYIKIAILMSYLILGLLITARDTRQRYDIVGESHQWPDPGLGLGASILTSLMLTTFMWAMIECIVEMTATASRNHDNIGVSMTMRGHYKFPAEHSQRVSSRRVLFWRGQAILCLLPIAPGLVLDYVESSTPNDRNRKLVWSLICAAWSFEAMLSWISVGYLGFRTIFWLSHNPPLRVQNSPRKMLGRFCAFIAHACSALQSLAILGSTTMALAILQSTSPAALSFLTHSASYQKTLEAVVASSFYQSSDLIWIVIAAGLVLLMVPSIGFFYSGLARRKRVLSTLYLIVFSTAVFTFQLYFWGYCRGVDANLASLTRHVVAVWSANKTHMMIWVVFSAQVMLTFLASAVVVRSPVRMIRSILVSNGLR